MTENKEEKKLWGGRFKKETNSLLEQYSESITYDCQLYVYDILGSMVHAEMLNKIGILTDEEKDLIVTTLKKIMDDIDDEKIEFDIKYEDIHMFIEAELTKRIGDVGKKLHTARSRNDQISLDMRLYLTEHIEMLVESLMALQEVFVNFAEKNIAIIMPEFTHLQHAQPVLMSHHVMAYVEMFERDIDRLYEAFARMNRMPLGSGACVGTGIPIDREFMRAKLDFAELTQNSVDAVSDRDYIIDTLYCLSMISMHLSRICEELIIWSTPEFDFIELPDEFCTGSSMMPQKKNPDVLELMRGKTGSIYGALHSVLCLMKGLPLTYNRDMQEDKKSLFESMFTIIDSVEILIAMFPEIEVNEEKCLNSARKGFSYATDMAEYLVKKGCPFRQAHEILGNMVAYCIENNKPGYKLTIEELKQFSDLFEKDVFELMAVENSVKLKDIVGGTAPNQVKYQIQKFREKQDQV